MPAPVKSYLIAATQRSGSTMLCRALADTGVAGSPEEYFLSGAPESFPLGWKFWEQGLFGRPDGTMTRSEYVEHVYELGTTSNGVFGAKLMWNNVSFVLDKLAELPRFRGLNRVEAFHQLLPDLHVIRLTRRDRVGQAVSWSRAAQDGVWVVSDAEPSSPAGPASYSYEFINNLERLIREGEEGWEALCSELGVTPLEVVYEDLVGADTYVDTIAACLGHLGIDSPDVKIAAPRTHRQADETNAHWSDQFLEERSSRAH
jgi:trehalose 2-sulfotransferase